MYQSHREEAQSRKTEPVAKLINGDLTPIHCLVGTLYLAIFELVDPLKQYGIHLNSAYWALYYQGSKARPKG